MYRKLICSASAMAIIALTLSIPGHAADGAALQLVYVAPPSVKPPGWQDTLSLDDWLKLLATQTCEMQNHRMYETLNQCVKAEATKLGEYYKQLHEASFHMQLCCGR